MIGFNEHQEREIDQLVSFFRNMGFTQSSDISKYIWNNKLGYKFPHISGFLEMRNGSDNWTFKGGIAPRFYREICERLRLGNNGSRAQVVGFKSFAELALA